MNEFLKSKFDNNQKYLLIFEKENFPYSIKKEDMKYFNVILKAITKSKLLNMKYLSKRTNNLKYKTKLQKKMCKTQITLGFIYLYEYYDHKLFYKKLFQIATLYFKNNSFLDVNDILEIIHYNLFYTLIDINDSKKLIYNKCTLFNISLNYLVEIITRDIQKIKIDIIDKIFDSLHQFLTKNKKVLFFLRKEDYNINENISLIKINEIKCLLDLMDNNEKEEIKKIKNKINEILFLVYGFNINKLYMDYLLKNLRNSFTELKAKDYCKEKIINSLYKLNNQINSLNELFLYEDNIITKNNKDPYMPRRYFVFNDSDKSGINYNPKMCLTNNNFILIFSFKQLESKENKVYPLFTFTNETDISFGIYLKNKKLTIYFQNDYIESAETEILLNKSYLIILEFNKNSLRNDVVQLYINGEGPKTITGRIKYKQNSIINIGYLPENINKKNEYKDSTSNYIGIIGPILFFNYHIEEKEFYENIFKLQGFYDELININPNTFIYNDIFNHEINTIKDETKNYFMSISKKIEECLLFNFSPISLVNDYQIKMFNSCNDYNNINFIENINGSNSNKGKNNIVDEFSTLDVPFKEGTYPVYEISSVYYFIQNDGFSIITLQFEFLYNLLRMLISLNDQKENNNNNNKSSIYYHINISIVPLLNLLYDIIKQSSNIITQYKDSLDTIGFSLLKIFKILINKTPLSSELMSNYRQFLLNINRIYIKTKNNDSIKVIQNFINKLLIMVCDIKYFDMNNNKEFLDYLSLFKIVIKNNEFLINSEILDLLLNFAFILDKKNFSNNLEYKQLSKEYKNVLMIFISQIKTIKLNCEYIQKVCNNEDNNFLIIYKLIKIYYIYNNIKNVYKQDNDNDTGEKINLFFNIFKRDNSNNVYHILNKEKLFKEYKRQFNHLINNYNYNIKDEEKKYLELLKCIFIQLIYEQAVLVIPSKLEKNYLEANLLLSNIEISFFKVDDIMNIKNTDRISQRPNRRVFYSFSLDNDIEIVEDYIKEKDRKFSDFNDNYSKKIGSQKNLGRISLSLENNLNLNEKSNSDNRKVYGLFDELIIYDDDQSLRDDVQLNMYIIKSLFGCLYDTWNKDYKLKFIKDIDDTSYKSYNMCFNDFNRFKQKLFFQFIQFLEYIQNLDLFEKIIRLVFSFIKQTINIYKSDQNEANSRRIFIHLIENKRTMKYLFNLCLNNNDKITSNKNLKQYVESSIADIINNIMIFHPKPFIFSYIKSCFKNNNKIVIQIIKNINSFIINDLKNNEINNKYNISISFYLFNIIKYINLIKTCFQKYEKNSQTLLFENDYYLLNIMNNIIEEFTKNYIIFDSKIYTYNPKSLLYIYNKNSDDNYNEEEKNKDKKYIKLIKETDTKIINDEGLFIIIVELSFQIIYLLWTIRGTLNNIVNRMNIDKFISQIYNYFYVEEHFLSYYIDLMNEYFTYHQTRKHENLVVKIPKDINEMIKNSLIIKKEYKKYFLQNPYIKDNRLASVIIFLLFMKYQSKIINYEYNQISSNFGNDTNIKEKIEKQFENFVQKSLGDVVLIYQNINKIKDDKKLKYFFRREDKSSKDNLFKKMHQNYYEYLLNIIKKKEITFVSKTLISEIEKKFMKEIEDEENNRNNNLLIGKISSENINNKLLDDMYNVNINNTEENKKINNEEQKKNKNEVINENNKFQDEFTIIESKAMSNDENEINPNNLVIFEQNLENNTDEINNEYNESNNDIENTFTNYFTDIKNPILCTKRDLVLKNLGYYFYEDYFNDENFINLRKKFMYIYPPDDLVNNYNKLEKLMSLKFPSTMKNYSNCDVYNPRIFLRPDKHFFENKFFLVGHKYFKEYKNINNPNFEYGHGLLNQESFELFEINNDKKENNKNEEKNNVNFGFDKSTPCYETELLCFNNNFQGFIIIKENYIVYQTNMSFDFNKYKNDMNYILSSKKEEIIQIPKQVIIPYKHIKQMIKRKFIFFNQALEIFLYNGKSYLFNFYKETIRDDFFNNIEKINIDKKYNFELIKDPENYFIKKKFTSNWLDKKITTLEYLLKINKFSGRTYNDLTKYLVLPWTLKDYLDINDKNNIRDFSLPMSAQEKDNLEIIINNYNIDNEPDKSYFKCHYSNSSYVTIYLFRINPFTNNQIKLQSGKFDSPNRQIMNLQTICNIFKDYKETCELIPEYFYLIESFLNMNYNFYGYLNSNQKSIVNNLKLTKDFDSLLELILFHQNFLNSDEISSQIHKWIDNIYGENQITDKKNVINSFPFECYEQKKKKIIENRIKELNKCKDENLNITKEIADVKSDLMMTYLLGQCPVQLFKKSHPQYQAKNTENNFNKIIFKKDVKSLAYKEFLYMNENIPISDNSESNYFYIVTNEKILVFNKQFKSCANLCINNLKKIYPTFDSDYISDKKKDTKDNNINDNKINNDNNNDKENDMKYILYYKQYFYKRLIFEIEECKFFFIGGYLDNSYKVYFKNKEKSICYNYITNSLITCMKYMKNTKIFFTGHINGQIIKWRYNIPNKSKDLNINCIKVSSLLAHKSGVSLIEIHDKLELFLSSSNKDGIIFIRKLYDYELLSVIKYNNLNKQIMDIIIDKEYFIITYNYKKNINNKIQKIVTYSVNGIKLSKIKIENEDCNEDYIDKYIILPISIQQNNDNMFMLSKNKINFMKITGKNKIELIPIDENMLKCINKGESIDIINQRKYDFVDDFNSKLDINIIISYFYDFYNHVLYCLFSSGHLYRINLYPKEFIRKESINK